MQSKALISAEEFASVDVHMPIGMQDRIVVEAVLGVELPNMAATMADTKDANCHHPSSGGEDCAKDHADSESIQEGGTSYGALEHIFNQLPQSSACTEARTIDLMTRAMTVRHSGIREQCSGYWLLFI